MKKYNATLTLRVVNTDDYHEVASENIEVQGIRNGDGLSGFRSHVNCLIDFTAIAMDESIQMPDPRIAELKAQLIKAEKTSNDYRSKFWAEETVTKKLKCEMKGMVDLHNSTVSEPEPDLVAVEGATDET